MLRILAPSDYRVMPWKNGGGTTTEIHIHPEGAGWNDFLWRVGIADIGQSGPFSSFPGIARSIMLLECPHGSGMRLTVDDAEVDLPLRTFVDFRGEAVTSGTLLGAPVRDFNVMSRRATVRHARGCKTLAPDGVLGWPESNWQFGYVIAGQAIVGEGTSAQTVDAGHAVLASGSAAHVALRAAGAGCTIVWAAFST